MHLFASLFSTLSVRHKEKSVHSKTVTFCSVEKKPKLDLLRTCVAAIPRLMPSNDLSVSELVEILLRYTVHIDEELKVYVMFVCTNVPYQQLRVAEGLNTGSPVFYIHLDHRSKWSNRRAGNPI